jgi:hypothetical protein
MQYASKSLEPSTRSSRSVLDPNGLNGEITDDSIRCNSALDPSCGTPKKTVAIVESAMFV